MRRSTFPLQNDLSLERLVQSSTASTQLRVRQQHSFSSPGLAPALHALSLPAENPAQRVRDYQHAMTSQHPSVLMNMGINFQPNRSMLAAALLPRRNVSLAELITSDMALQLALAARGFGSAVQALQGGREVRNVRDDSRNEASPA